MCGVVAIFSFREPVDRAELDAIRDHMTSRGPDGFGSWLSDDNRVALGHRRLSIIDLSNSGAQPMRHGACSISYNGEIYNYRSLKRELESKGRVFRSTSDTEVLLQLYDELGTAMFERLRGMYAFALYDERLGKVLVARDGYGIKPLYYAQTDSGVRVASQVKALLHGGNIAKTPDLGGVAGFYIFGSVPEPFTCYRQIRALPAGSYAWIDEGGMSEPQRHFSLASELATAAKNKRRLSPDMLQQQVRAALRETVEHHLVADVPVGAFLSAGVDSGSLVGLMRELGQNEVQTVTLSFGEFRNDMHDEAPLAAQLARHYGTQHTTQQITASDFRSWRPHILAAMDQPSIDGINTWMVSRAAADQGLKVAVSGLGGDELVGGYDTAAVISRWMRWMKLPSRLPLLGRAFRVGYRAVLEGRVPFSPKLAGIIEHGGSYAGAYLLKRSVFMPWELDALMGSEAAREGLERLRPLPLVDACLQPDPGTLHSRVAALEAGLYMKNQLLRDSDWASMAHSLEVRVPLVDIPLLRAIAPLMAAHPEASGKRLTAQSPQRPLPTAVLERKKTGFALPLKQWVEDDGELDAWRRIPVLKRPGCHWARRLAFSLVNAET